MIDNSQSRRSCSQFEVGDIIFSHSRGNIWYLTLLIRKIDPEIYCEYFEELVLAGSDSLSIGRKVGCDYRRNTLTHIKI